MEYTVNTQIMAPYNVRFLLMQLLPKPLWGNATALEVLWKHKVISLCIQHQLYKLFPYLLNQVDQVLEVQVVAIIANKFIWQFALKEARHLVREYEA